MPNLFRRRISQEEIELQNMLNAAQLYDNNSDYPLTGEAKFVLRKGQVWPKKLEDGPYVYCVKQDGEVRFSVYPRPKSKIHHPELVKGGAVIAAGMLCISNNTIWEVSCESGHYKPDVDSVYFAILALRYWNAPVSDEIKQDVRWAHFR